MADSIRSQAFDLGIKIEGMDNLIKVSKEFDEIAKKVDNLNKLSAIHMPSATTSGLDKVNSRLDEIERKFQKIKSTSSSISPHINTNGIDGITRSANSSYRAIKNNTSESQKLASSFQGLIPVSEHSSREINGSFNKVHSGANHARNGVDVLNGSFEKISNTTEKTSGRFSGLRNRAGKVHSKFSDLKVSGGNLVNTFNNITVALIPLALGFKNAFDSATKLNDEYNIIKNLEVGNGVSESSARRTVGQMKNANRDLSLKYGIDQNDLARGSEELIRRGYSGKQDLAAHKYFAQAALATHESYHDIIQAGAPVLEQFGFKAKAGDSVEKMRRYTKDVLNRMAYVADVTAGDNKEFGESFKYMGTTMHQNHQSLNTALGALGTLSNYGIYGSIAGTNLKNIVSRLNRAESSKAIRSGLKDLGVSPQQLYNRHGDLKDLPDIFDLIRRGTKRRHLTSSRISSDLQSVFGAWAFNSANTLLNHGEDWRRNIKKSRVANRENYISKLAQKNMDSLQGQINITKAKLSDIGMNFASTVAPQLATVLKAINGVLDWLGKLPNPVKKATTYAVGVAGTLGALRVGRGILGKTANILGLGGNSKAARKIRLIRGKDADISSKIPDNFKDILGTAENTKNTENATGWLARTKAVNGGKLFTTGGLLALGSGAIQGGIDIAQGVHYNSGKKYNRRNNFLGKGVGSLVGTGAGFAIGAPFGLGPLGAIVGSQAGEFLGGFAGNAFTGYNLKKAPKNKLSGQNFGWSFHNWKKQANPLQGAGIGSFIGGLIGNPAVGTAIGTLIGTKWTGKGSVQDNLGKFGIWAKNSWNGTGRNLGNFGKWAGNSWNGTKRNIGNFGKWASDSWDGTTRNIGNFNKTVGNIVGSTHKYLTSGGLIRDGHKLWKAAIEQSHEFFVSLPKNFNKLKSNVTKIWDDTWRNINNNRYVKAFKHGHLLGTAFSDIEKNTRGFRQNIGKTWNNTWKSVNNNRYLKAFKKGHLIKTVLDDTEKNTRSFRQHFGKTWNSTLNSAQKKTNNFKKDVGKNWNAMWGVINSNRYVRAFKRGNFFGQVLDDIQSRFDSFMKPFKKAWKGFWGFLQDQMDRFVNWAQDSWNGTVNHIVDGANDFIGAANDINYAFGGNGKAFGYLKHQGRKSSKGKKVSAHANGGRVSKTALSLVGEQGVELAFKDGGSHARLLGANGTAFEKVHAGEKILNARDTQKVLNGSFIGRISAYAGGTTKITNSYDKIAKKSDKTWNSVEKKATRHAKNTRIKVVSDTKGLAKGIDKYMDAIHDGTINTADKTAKGFGKKFSKLKGYTEDAMQGVRKAMNTGITGIDKMLTQFGGNDAVIKPVKFAKGTNGKLANNTLAMVNDSPIGKRQEAIIRNNNVFLPKGQDVILPLKKNDQVLNGEQTDKLIKMINTIPHFAKGSGVSDSQLRRIATRNARHPIIAFKNMYTTKVNPKGKDIQKGMTKTTLGATNKLGGNWSDAMWSVITEAMGGNNGHGGSREAFLRYAEEHFSGKPYRMGAMGPEYYDCSGMVATALKHFGIDVGRTTVAMQHSSGLQYLGKDVHKTTAGDLAIYGHGAGAAGHVGIIKNPDRDSMFNATPPSARVSSISAPESMGFGFYRVKGLHDATKKVDKHNNALKALAKKELGSRALAWIRKHLSESLGGFTLGGDLATRVNRLAKALRSADSNATKNGIAAIIGNWIFESGLNPSAVNQGGGASGLGQWLGGRLSNLKAFAKHRGTSWSNPATQLLFALKHDGSDSAVFKSVLEGKGSVADLAAKFSNQWERGGYTTQHVNGARQAAKALGYKNGGDPVPNTKVRVNEEGGEVAEFKSPVHIYSKEEAKRRFAISDGVATAKKVITNKQQPNITVNVTGNYIDSNKRENSLLTKIRNVVREEIAQSMEQIGDDYGDDLSIY